MEEYIFYTIIIIFILFLIYQWRITLNQKKQLENQLEQKVNELKDTLESIIISRLPGI